MLSRRESCPYWPFRPSSFFVFSPPISRRLISDKQHSFLGVSQPYAPASCALPLRRYGVNVGLYFLLLMSFSTKQLNYIYSYMLLAHQRREVTADRRSRSLAVTPATLVVYIYITRARASRVCELYILFFIFFVLNFFVLLPCKYNI